eukprot:768561-Hanusia_phi.AAC.1
MGLNGGGDKGWGTSKTIKGYQSMGVGLLQRNERLDLVESKGYSFQGSETKSRANVIQEGVVKLNRVCPVARVG